MCPTQSRAWRAPSVEGRHTVQAGWRWKLTVSMTLEYIWDETARLGGCFRDRGLMVHWQLGGAGEGGEAPERSHLRSSTHKTLPTHLDLNCDNFGASGLRS